jgi:hypothetical protein
VQIVFADPTVPLYPDKQEPHVLATTEQLFRCNEAQKAAVAPLQSAGPELKQLVPSKDKVYPGLQSQL